MSLWAGGGKGGYFELVMEVSFRIRQLVVTGNYCCRPLQVRAFTLAPYSSCLCHPSLFLLLPDCLPVSSFFFVFCFFVSPACACRERREVLVMLGTREKVDGSEGTTPHVV